jgi:hypothetical protein
VISGSHSELMVEVHAKGYRPGPDQGALSLVAACAGTGGHNRVDGRSIRLVGDGTVRFSVEPGLGTHNRRKLVGCLEDATIDRLRGDVVSIETIAP